jgi:ankyrin repeat protein
MGAPSEHGQWRLIHAAFCAGDLDALRAAVDHPELLPNGPMPQTIGSCLVYAIYHSPLSFVRELLELGADPNPSEHDGFPPLYAALWMSTRKDKLELLELLLSFGADPNQRGHNDYTVLHVAVLEQNRRAAEILLAAGADPRLRTRIDDLETPIELAIGAGLEDMVALLERWTSD